MVKQTEDNYQIPLPLKDDWPSKDGTMALPKSVPDNVLDPSDKASPGYKNVNTPWWDGSQLYGNSEQQTRSLRTRDPDGKLMLTEDNKEAFLPRDEKTGLPDTGFNNNWYMSPPFL